MQSISMSTNLKQLVDQAQNQEIDNIQSIFIGIILLKAKYNNKKFRQYTVYKSFFSGYQFF